MVYVAIAVVIWAVVALLFFNVLAHYGGPVWWAVLCATFWMLLVVGAVAVAAVGSVVQTVKPQRP